MRAVRHPLHDHERRTWRGEYMSSCSERMEGSAPLPSDSGGAGLMAGVAAAVGGCMANPPMALPSWSTPNSDADPGYPAVRLGTYPGEAGPLVGRDMPCIAAAISICCCWCCCC
jgi:hypothetical protein